MVNHMYSQSFSLNREIDEFIDRQKKIFKRSRSSIFRDILEYFMKNPEKLKDILKIDYEKIKQN